MYMKKIDQYLTINQASYKLGISPSTLRNWSREDKIKTYINPNNSYRLYLIEDIEKLLNQIKEGV